MDIIGVIVTLGYVFFLIFLSKILSEEYDTDIGRRVLHMGIGFPGIFVWFLYNTRLGAIVPPLFATIFLIVAPKNLRKKFSKGDELHVGLILYCISVTILTGIFWQDQIKERFWIGAASFITLAWGDGLGGAFGKRYGTHTYDIPWVKEKSIEGSLGVGLGAAFGITFAQIIFGHIFPPHFLILFLGAILAMFLEAIAPKHSDNILLPLGLATFLSVIYMLLL